ncbi:MAG: hypothetical protein AAFQ87_08220, partial [Bacteroidota bacterium]
RERSHVLANTSLKLAGGVNAKDAKLLATEMGCRPEFLQAMQKADDASETEFALWVRNSIREAVKVTVPIGTMEKLPRMTKLDFAAVKQRNRELFCWKYADSDNTQEISFPGYERPKEKTDEADEQVSEIEETEATPESSDKEDDVAVAPPEEASPEPKPGRGGYSHTETQALLTSLAHHFGWRAETEHPVADGYVDVWLSREGREIACEVTVSTEVAYEIGNIEKCLAAGADEVWLISEDQAKLDTIKERMDHTPKVWFFSPDMLEAELSARTPRDQTDELVIRGYKVEVVNGFLAETEAEARRERLAHLIDNLEYNR